MSRSPKYVGWKRVIVFLALICLLPLAPEIIVLLDVVGLEATVLFLLMYSHSLFQDMAGRASYAYYFAESLVYTKHAYQPATSCGFGITVVASAIVIFATGSLPLALFTWSPLFLTVY